MNVQETFSADAELAFQQLEGQINGAKNHWSHKLRQQGLKALSAMPFPNRKAEEWKYTSFEKLVRNGLLPSLGAEATAISKEDLGLFQEAKAKAVFVNGVFNEALSSLPAYAKVLRSGKDEDQLPEQFGTAKVLQDYYFSQLNAGFWKEALVIHSQQAENEPLHIIHLSDGGAKPQFYHPRLFIALGAHAELSLSEVYMGKGTHTVWHNSLAEIHLAENAKCSHAILQADEATTHHTGLVVARQEKHSTYDNHCITFGGGMTRNDLWIDLDGAETECNMYGLYLTDGDMHVDNHTSVDHKEPNAYSNELYKGILKGQSTAVFNGKIFVRQKAQKTNAFQSNRNVLLSDEATINTKPQLEIWADDVKCSHGATTGRLDEESLFYLQSRGLGKESARKLLLKAFSGEVIDKLPSDLCRNFLEQELPQRF